jgi:hypothetical protein
MTVLYRSPIDGAQILQDGSTTPGGWFKSSRSAGNGACVEARRWRKSTKSGDTANCVEVATAPDGMLVRDSKDPDGPVLVFARDSWLAFVEDVKAGELG